MTDEQRWLSRQYLVYQVFTNLWFLSAVWLYFYRIFITDQRVGVLDSLAFTVGLIAEIPSGALADKFGRDRLVRLGQILSGGGLLLQAAGSSFTVFLIGQGIMMVGVSFASGADEALFFERLHFEPKSTAWRKLLMRGSQVALIGTLSTTLIGGWLYGLSPRLPWLLTGVSFIVAALLIWPVKDTRPKQNRQKPSLELRSYFVDITAGVRQFRLPQLRLYVALIVTVQGLFYATGFGLLRIVLMSRFRFDPRWGAVLIAGSGIATVGLLSYLHKHAEKMSEKHVLGTIAISAAAGLLLSAADIGYWGGFVIFALYAGEHVLSPFMSEVLNYHAPERQRATTLSIASFLKAMPYVALAPLIGTLNTHRKLQYFLFGWPILICLALAIYLFSRRHDAHIPLEVSGETAEHSHELLKTAEPQ